MVRNLLKMTALVAMTATAATAQKNAAPSVDLAGTPRTGPLIYSSSPDIGEPPPAPTPKGLSEWQAGQLVRWGGVGKCVVAKDRDASRFYVAARPGSPEAAEAARRLEPVFTSCLARSGIMARNNKAYRRAAVADALGVRLSS